MSGFKWLRRLRSGKKKKLLTEEQNISQRLAQLEGVKLTTSLEENLALVKEILGNSDDVTFRRFLAPGQVPMAIVFVEGLTYSPHIHMVIQALTMELYQANIQHPKRASDYKLDVLEKILPVEELYLVRTFSDLVDGVTRGDAALFIQGHKTSLVLNTKQRETRQTSEPETETVIRGPRDGFVENIRINTSLIRRRIRTSQLRIENINIGKLTKTKVSFVYIKGLAKDKLVEEVRTRLGKIEIDGILESGYLEEFIEDTPFTLIPLLKRTERPDIACSCLLEGKVVILTDTTPFALTVPTTVNEMLQAPDDYYEKVPLGTALRLLRVISLFISMLLPGAYVAIINFHMELLPTSLLLSITATREGVPFPVVVEVLIMESLFEVLREAGVRLPRVVGPAISIVGALILGDAAIRAGIVSPAVVIIVALTAIASFTVPVFSLGIAGRLLRFAFVGLGATFGLFGIQFGLLLLIIHVCSLRSFGIPISVPFAPLIIQDLKDSIIRWWWWGMTTRPKALGGREPWRQPKTEGPNREKKNRE